MKKLKAMVAILLSFTLISIPGTKVSTKVNADIDTEKISEKITFLESNEMHDSLNIIKSNDKASSKLQQDYIEKGYVKVNLIKKSDFLTKEEKKQSNTSYAFDIDTVKNNASLIKKIKEIKKQGVIIYLYGNKITLKDYDEIVGLDDVGIYYTNQENNLKKNGSPTLKLGLDNSTVYYVIGFKSGDIGSLYLYDIQNFDDKGRIDTQKVDEFKLINGILEDAAYKVRKKLSKKDIRSVKVSGFKIPFIQKSIANAQSTYVRASPHNAKDFYKNNFHMAHLDTLWTLLREYNENDLTYDYFSLETAYELYGDYYWITSADIKHSLPYSWDCIKSWGPHDNASSSFTVSVPWSISYTFSTTSSISVDECGSQSNDYGRWKISPRWWQSNISNGPDDIVYFTPATAWFSIGKYAEIDSNISLVFRNYTLWPYDLFGSQQILIRYAYTN